MLCYNLQPPFQSQVINDAYAKDIDDLKTGQLVNGEAIQSLANSVSHIVYVLAESQANKEFNTNNYDLTLRIYSLRVNTLNMLIQTIPKAVLMLKD